MHDLINKEQKNKPYQTTIKHIKHIQKNENNNNKNNNNH